MYFWTGLMLSLLYGLLNPFSERLQAASLWAGKALTPKELAVSAPLGLQPSLTAGWPSNVIFVVPLLLVTAAILGFIHAWWAGLLMLFVGSFVSVIAKGTAIAPRALECYLMMLAKHALRRSNTYSAKRDTARTLAAKELFSRVSELHCLYVGSGVVTPTYKQAQSAPFGNPNVFLSGR